MNKTINLLAGLTLAVSAFNLIAQPAPGDPQGGPEPGRHRPPPPPLVAVLDANHDGVIDAEEIANAAAALKTLDKNNDGQLTPDEFMPPRRGPGGPRGVQGRGPGGPPPGAADQDGQRPPRPPLSPLLGALDANHDGVIDAEEIANAAAALKTLDKNNDGQLTPDELMPPRRGPGGPRGAHGRGQFGPPPGGPDAVPPQQN
ncbi:MAG: EF-hand domain-containing protein [Limisphaerales bacterium]